MASAEHIPRDSTALALKPSSNSMTPALTVNLWCAPVIGLNMLQRNTCMGRGTAPTGTLFTSGKALPHENRKACLHCLMQHVLVRGTTRRLWKLQRDLQNSPQHSPQHFIPNPACGRGKALLDRTMLNVVQVSFLVPGLELHVCNNAPMWCSPGWCVSTANQPTCSGSSPWITAHLTVCVRSSVVKLF